MIELDAIDRKLILALVQDASQSASALGRAFGLSQPAMWRRIKRLEEAGVLKGRQLRLNAQMLGFGVTVFLGVKLATKGRVSLDDFERAVVAIPEVQTVEHVLGLYDYRLRVVARVVVCVVRLSSGLNIFFTSCGRSGFPFHLAPPWSSLTSRASGTSRWRAHCRTPRSCRCCRST